MTKKIIVLVLMLVVISFAMTGCSESYEDTEIEATVTKCEIGTFHKNDIYQGTANMYLTQKDLGMYNLYSQLAQSNGYYDYFITFATEDGAEHIVMRTKAYAVGEKITVTVRTDNSGKIEYK